MQALLGEEFPQFLDIYTQPAVSGLRINTLKISIEDFNQISPFPLEQLDWSEDSFSLLPHDPPLQPGKHPYHPAGLYYLQDPSAMAVVELLDPHLGEKVLDLSAAPGGKSTHIISRMHNQGLLVANEMHPKRAWDLAENLERWGARNTVILNEEPRRLAEHFGPFFDRVLVDAPCSGEGMFRKSLPARAAWSLQLVQSCALRQINILEQAARLVRPGGVLVYSTCTFAPEEDEGVIARFLATHSAKDSTPFEVVQLRENKSFSQGNPAWLETVSKEKLLSSIAVQLERTVRLWPHLGAPEGHFIAVLKRIDHGPPATIKNFHTQIPKAARLAFLRFCEENLSDSLSNKVAQELNLEGTYFYARPSMLPSLGSLQTIHPGWWLGQLKSGRCEPAHALAMAITPESAKRHVRLEMNSPSLRAYLGGESLNLPGENGWVLVCIGIDELNQAFSLGWGKRSAGVLKNSYPRGLRVR
jgi:16S rRNA C967 or C1407 C5-methylase (RsmB/RsmF family)/NOL1/NOP2/fmu family ribosome biogenesis protein